MSNPRVLVIGNDLIGSSATGALFARFGIHTMTVRDGATVLDIDASDAEIIVCDATRNAHLRVIAAAARVSATWLSVDSGSFGGRLAAALGIAPGDHPPPILAVIGSITAITSDQVLETEQSPWCQVHRSGQQRGCRGDRRPDRGPARPESPSGRRPARIPALSRELAARLPRVLAESARLALTRYRYATGGDIATAIIAALDTDGFMIDDEVVPLAGGPFNGLPFATKGGLIGARTAAVARIERLKGIS